MKQETWLPVKGYEGLYEVSNAGNTRSLDKWCQIGRYGKVLKKGKILKTEMKCGYCMVRLYIGEKKREAKLVHRLVAEAFIPNLHNKEMVNHKDTDKANNKVNNLEWVTRTENMQHASRMGLLNNVGNRINNGTTRKAA